jgi:thymidylate kinase
MAWILVEGLDRSGKSSIAEMYRKKGYTVVHMEAPSKKYYSDTYAGESYLEELVRMYSKYEGQNVLFDRTVYGELVWPNIYGRLPLLEAEDLEYLAQIEKNNSAEKILMFDANTEAHWQRCVANNEPLTRQQFGRASIFYDRLAKEYGFKKKQLTDFEEFNGLKQSSTNTPIQSGSGSNNRSDENVAETKSTVVSGNRTTDSRSSVETLANKLEMANAINDVLEGKILKKKGGLYDELENEIKSFLQGKLEEIFVGKPEKNFSTDEITILKSMAQRIKEKM